MPPTQIVVLGRHIARPLLLPVVLLLAGASAAFPAAAFTSGQLVREAASHLSPAMQEEAAPSVVCPTAQKRFHEYGKEVRNAFWGIYRNGGETVYCAAAFAARSRRTTIDKLPSISSMWCRRPI